MSGKYNKEVDKHYARRTSKYGSKDGQDNSGLMYRHVMWDYYKTHNKPKSIFKLVKDAKNMSGKVMEQEAKHYTRRNTYDRKPSARSIQNPQKIYAQDKDRRRKQGQRASSQR